MDGSWGMDGDHMGEHEDGQMRPKHSSRNVTRFGGICFKGLGCSGIETHVGLPIET